jgi:hypothetical protein
LAPADQAERRVLLEQHDKIDRFERCEHFSARLLVPLRPALANEFSSFAICDPRCGTHQRNLGHIAANFSES